MKHSLQFNKKTTRGVRGVSIIISYVLLILLSVSMAGLVYTFLQYRARLPAEIKCPEGTAVYLYNFTCDNFNLTIKNNGLFNISGINVKSYNSSLCNQTGDIDLIIAPNEINSAIVGGCINLKKIDILPFRKEQKGARVQRIYCNDARIITEVNC